MCVISQAINQQHEGQDGSHVGGKSIKGSTINAKPRLDSVDLAVRAPLVDDA